MWRKVVWWSFLLGSFSTVQANTLCPSGSPFIVKKCSNDSACSTVSEYCHQGTCCPKDHVNTAQARCSYDAMFVPQTECKADPNVCRAGDICDPVTKWCCPPLREKRCPEGYQVQTFCRNGEACPGGMDCIDGSCCPVPLNSGPVFACPGGNPVIIKSCAKNESCSQTEFCHLGTCCPSAINKKPGDCPAVADGVFGICVEECSNDAACDSDLKCCSNGCGHTCQKPTILKTGKCPASLNRLGGLCIGQKDVPSCKNDQDCPGKELCCRSECEVNVCSSPEEKTPCQRELEAATIQVLSQVDSCNPVFIPRCDSNGNFHRTQCYDHNGMCFCVFPNGTKIPGTEERGNPDCSRATKSGVCPHYTTLPAIDLRCMETCQSDDSCQGDQKCCSNGCGYHCMGPVGHNSVTTRRKRNAQARCSYDAMFVPQTECTADPNVCRAGNICDPVTKWCCPPLREKRCSAGYQVQTFCRNGEACPGGMDCIDGSCCPVPLNSGPAMLSYSCMADGMVTSTRCDLEGGCTGAFHCESGFCCPTRLNDGEHVCQVDGYRSTQRCDSEGGCASGSHHCESGYCCPTRLNEGHVCQVDSYRSTQRCDSEGGCASGSHHCESGFCCPTRLNEEHVCQVDGYRSTQRCDSEGGCASGSHHCESGYCCPTRVNEGTICLYRRYIATSVTYIGSVASGTMPSVEACKAACDRDTISDCIGVVYQDNTGKCTKFPDTSHLTKVASADSEFYERHCQFSAGLCPDQDNVLLSDGVPKTCYVDTDCEVNSFGCIKGHCCPKGQVSTVPPVVTTCSNGANPAKNVNGFTKTCTVASDCGEPATCENQICCPAPIQEELCPNKSLPLMENGKPKACMGILQSECGSSGDYTCKGTGDSKYCCPARLNNNELCPNKGMPLLNSAGNAQRCASTMDCGDGTYSCQSSNIDGYKYCCPAKLLITEMCPNIGYVLVHDGHPKRCSLDFECISSSGEFSCVKNYCCPNDPSQAVCPNNGGLLLDEAQQPKLCMENIECQGSGKGAYFCNNGYCCPESGSLAVCPNNEKMKLVNDKAVTCVHDADCGEALWSCQGGHCCSRPVNTVCPNGTAPMCCKLDLCVQNSCPSNPTAKCRINPCGGCKVEFYDDKNTPVDCDSALSRCEKLRLKALTVNAFWMDTDVEYSRMYLGQLESQNVQDNSLQVAERVISSGKPGECMGLSPTAVRGLINDCTTDEDCPSTSKCCLNKCQVPINILPRQNACDLLPVAGPCKGRMVRYFYNSANKQCQQFVYGGCQGNDNNFGSQEACERACSAAGLPPQCLPAPDPGRCKAQIPMYFYNITSNICEKFDYGGCDGNRNRFLTLTQCLSTCSSKDVQAGPCEKIRCAADTICLPVSGTEAKCISDKVPPVVDGNFVPDCLENGDFAEMQCLGSLCWCVDVHGDMKPNTMRVGKPPCYKSVSGVTGADEISKVPVCADGSAPMLCDKNECRTAKCEGRKDATCVVDPCNKCQVSFRDSNNKPVTCEVDKCSLKIPISASRNKQGCGNLVQRWVHDANTGKCEHFLFSPCDGEDVYYTSQWECRSKCIGTICDGKGPKSCSTSCTDQVCRRFPAAQCQVHPCTCDVVFYDLVSNVPVDCDSVTPLCQLRRSQEKRKALMQEMDSSKVSESVPISVCDAKGEFTPQQCDTKAKKCWCVDGLGNQLQGSERIGTSPGQDIGCKQNKTTSAVVSLLFNLDYNVYVQGKEDKLKQVVMAKLKEISPKMVQYVKSVKIRKGSVYVDVEFGQTMASTEPVDIGSLVNVLENEVYSGLDMRFEGQTITAEPSVSSSFTFQAQTAGDVSKSPADGSNDSQTTTIVVVVICAVVLIAILVFFVIRKRRSQEKAFSNLNTSDPEGSPIKQNSVYYQNKACDRK
ncbi:uncharacterized protein [Magallana gigas]